MILRNDDELPPLTPSQQSEAIRIAARLQAAHEARASNEALLLAAEEAGIERRFLHEAFQSVEAKSRVVRTPHARIPWAAALAIALLLATGFLGITGAGGFRYDLALGLGLGIGLLMESKTRSWWSTPAFVLGGWVAMTLFFAGASGLRHGNTGMIDGRFFIWAFECQCATALGIALLRRAFSLTRHAPPVTLHTK